MYPASTARFRKLRTCPTADALILYGEAVLTRARREVIERHLSACDFCGAELQLLSKHRPHACPPLQFACEIPSHLRRLAEDLMSQPSHQGAHLVETIYELDRMTLTDAA